MGQFWPVVPIDTGWQVLTLDAGASVSGGLTPMIRRVGNVVYITGRVLQTGSQIAVLSAGLRPVSTIRMAAMTGSSGAGAAVLVVDPSSGSLFTSASTTVNLAHSWPV